MNPEFPNKLEYPISNLYNGNVNMYKVSKKKWREKMADISCFAFVLMFLLEESFEPCYTMTGISKFRPKSMMPFLI